MHDECENTVRENQNNNKMALQLASINFNKPLKEISSKQIFAVTFFSINNRRSIFLKTKTQDFMEV